MRMNESTIASTNWNTSTGMVESFFTPYICDCHASVHTHKKTPQKNSSFEHDENMAGIRVHKKYLCILSVTQGMENPTFIDGGGNQDSLL